MTQEKYLEAERIQSKISSIWRALKEIKKYENEQITDIAVSFGDYRTTVQIKPHYLPQIDLKTIQARLITELDILDAKFKEL